MKPSVVLTFLVALSVALHAHVTPSGGSREKALRQGERITITWDSSEVSFPVTLSLWDGERRSIIPIYHAYTAARSRYEWTVPDTLPPGRMYRFIVTSALTPAVRHLSESYVSIDASVPLVSSVASSQYETPIHVMPVPARDVLRVNWVQSDAQQITLTTLVGSPVASWQCPNGATQMDVGVTPIPSGLYLLTVTYAGGATATRPVVINH